MSDSADTGDSPTGRGRTPTGRRRRPGPGLESGLPQRESHGGPDLRLDRKRPAREGKCYKNIYYGIESHRCIQMTPVVRCNERCVFCWRDHNGHAYEMDDVEWDDPRPSSTPRFPSRRNSLGLWRQRGGPREVFEESMEPRHVAISLDGEPTLYPTFPN